MRYALARQVLFLGALSVVSTTLVRAAKSVATKPMSIADKQKRIQDLVLQEIPAISMENAAFTLPPDPAVSAELTQLVDKIIEAITSETMGIIDFDKINLLTVERLKALIPAQLQENPLGLIMSLAVVPPATLQNLATKMISTIAIIDEPTKIALQSKFIAWLNELTKHANLIPPYPSPKSISEAFTPLRTAVNPALRNGAVIGLVSLILDSVLYDLTITPEQLKNLLSGDQEIQKIIEKALGNPKQLKQLTATVVTKYKGTPLNAFRAVIVSLIVAFMPDSWFTELTAKASEMHFPL